MLKPNLVIKVVYSVNKDLWRGFCFPFDVTCEAETKGKAEKILEDSVSVYVEGLERHGYPDHLSLRSLSDPRDRGAFAIVNKIVVEDIKRRMLSNALKYQRRNKGIKLSLSNPRGTADYSPQYCSA